MCLCICVRLCDLLLHQHLYCVCVCVCVLLLHQHLCCCWRSLPENRQVLSPFCKHLSGPDISIPSSYSTIAHSGLTVTPWLENSNCGFKLLLQIVLSNESYLVCNVIQMHYFPQWTLISDFGQVQLCTFA